MDRKEIRQHKPHQCRSIHPFCIEKYRRRAWIGNNKKVKRFTTREIKVLRPGLSANGEKSPKTKSNTLHCFSFEGI